MTAPAHLIRGWCPGALRPMASGDGLLVRIRPRAGAFSISALKAIAKAASRFGSGEIDLTNRGNLQLRGLSEDSHEGAIAALRAAGLIDGNAALESVRNIVVDPLSGIDPARCDVRGLAARFEDALAEDTRLWVLPGKFGFSFSATPELLFGGGTSDIMIASLDSGFVIGLDGALDLCAIVLESALLDAVRGLAHVFMDLAAGDPALRRMRDAVSRFGAARIFAMAGLKASPLSSGAETHSTPAGLLARGDVVFGVGVGMPFGRVNARQLEALCEAAASPQFDCVFTGPERLLVFPVTGKAGAATILEAARHIGLIVSGSDVRLGMDVCTGAPGCRNATTDTRRDAQRLADTLHGALLGHFVHISGCAKGCARSSPAGVTMVARDGRYDFIRNGRPGDPAALADVESEDIAEVVSRFILEAAS